MALKAQGATFEAVREALLQSRGPEVANWARDSSEDADLRRLYDNASPERLLQVSDFVAHMPTKNMHLHADRRPWPAASVDARVPPCEVVDSQGNPVLNPDGEPRDATASAWLSSTRLSSR